MTYIYNGIESDDEDIINEAIFNKLSEEKRYPSDEDIETEWENVEVVK